MMQLISQMIRLPLAAFVYGMGMLAKTLQGLQKMSDQSVEAMVSGTTHILSCSPDGESITDDPGITDDGARSSAETANNTTHKEERKMRDQDLSGEDTLKLVRYKILFVKRDYEVAFPEKEELVSYSTTAPEWAGLKIAHFIGRLSKTKRPERWREKYFPPGVEGEFIERIPKEDEKYIKLYFEVLQRWDREEAEYDKQQVEVLRQIRDRIGEVSGKISG